MAAIKMMLVVSSLSSQELSPLGFRTKNMYAFLVSPFRATYPTRLTFFVVVTLMMLSKEYLSRNF